ncbi:MAG: prolyl oligopeptidase family serine peptidase [Planctomycetota bacterium]
MCPVRTRPALLVALLAGAFGGPASAVTAAQGSAADYARAAALRARFGGLVDRSVVRPEWIDEHRFWYQVDPGPEETEVILVDASAPEAERRRVLADRKLLSSTFDRSDVEIVRLAFHPDEPGVLHALCASAGVFAWDVDAAVAEPIDADEVDAFRYDVGGPDDVPSRSSNGGASSQVLIVNGSNVPLSLQWITPDGGRRGYGPIEPGGEQWQTSYDGHAFALVDDRGEDRAWFRVAERSGVAYVGPRDASATRAGAGGASRPRSGLSPDGTLRVHKRGGDLYVSEVDGNESVRVTEDGGDGGAAYRLPVRWAPDGRHFACLRVERQPARTVQFVESAPDGQLQPVVRSMRYRKPGDPIDREQPRLFRVQRDRGLRALELPIKGEHLFDTPWSVSRLEWSENGSQLTFLYNERGHRVLRWIGVDVEEARAATIVEDAPETFVDYAYKSFLHRFPGTDDALWMTERSGWNHLILVDARTGKVKREVTVGEWVVRSVEEVDDEARTALLRVMGIHPEQDPYHEHFVRVEVDTGRLTLLTESDGTHRIEASPDGQYHVATWSRVDHPPVTELRRAADGSLVCTLERADASRLHGAGWRVPERFVAKGRDGETDIWGVVYRPTNREPDGRYPIVESIYAGPHGAHVPKRWSVHRKPMELAELGFVVVQIDGMGTNWRSKAFHDVAWKNLGDAGFPDRIAWLRALAASDPSIDLDRLGIYGGSAGGQNAMRALIAHGDVYRAAVADCGCHDNRMDKIWWNELWMSWPVGPHYSESSNVDQAHRMRGDLMLVVGEIDRNVDPASTMQVVDALVKADRDFELVVLPGVGHGAAETDYGTRRRRDFFVRKLMGVEPRWTD